ncbi:MAG TPA: hypothetical protein IAB27_05310 [Candidatus Coprosoma intestinipullorum]|uniref:Uncharacterized protein n=1 Tax=Candidatus Coprosoma intestinipullorum TaxID=2840752 RepID=A0A9D1D035_9FIRM|nr:hypothetical protein [Candidatus Coprosoma intestinipullorum]
MSKKQTALEEAENIVDNMYKKRFEECGVTEGNTIHINNLDNVQFTELEEASITLLQNELRLKNKIQKYKEVINKAINKLGRYADETINNANAYAICVDLLDILKEVEHE